MTAIKNNLKRIWDCIEQKAPEIEDLFQPGLKSEEIDEITKDLPFKLPEEVYELYKWRNGLLNNTGFYLFDCDTLSSHFDSLETAIQNIIKIKSGKTFFYFLIIFWNDHENGRDFFAVPLGVDICPVIVLYDDNDIYRKNIDLHNEFQNQQDNYKTLKSISPNNKLINNRKIYNNFGDLIAEIADFTEQAFYNLERNIEHYYFINFNQQKREFIHYRYRFADEGKNIYCLTSVQESELFETKQSWLNLINTPINKQEATKVIQELYRYAEEEIPEIIFVPSFYTAHLGFFGQSEFLKQTENKYLADKLESLYWEFLLVPFYNALTEPVITSVLRLLKSELNEVLNDFLEYDLKSSIEKIFNNPIDSNSKSITKLLYSTLKYDLRDALNKDSMLLYFNYEHILSNDEFLASAALFEFAHLLGVEFNEQKLNLYISYCRETWCVIPFDKTVIVCEKPQVSWNKNSLPHVKNLPNLSFVDGYII